MREDNLNPKIKFDGPKMNISFKYPPTQEEFDAAITRIAEAMEYANKMTGDDIHIIGWEKKGEA